MLNNPACYATSQIFIQDPTNRHNDLELCTNTPNSMNYYPPVSSSSNSNGHVASRTSSAKICGPHLCEVSSSESDCYGTNVTGYSANSWIASYVTLEYINKLLEHEDSDDRVKLHHGEYYALNAMEEQFYELLGQDNPVYSNRLPRCNCDHLKNIDDDISKSCSICHIAICSGTGHSNHNLQVLEAPWSLSDIAKEKKQFAHSTLSMELGLNVDGLSVENRSQDNQSLQVKVANKSKHALSEVHSGNCPRTEDFQLLEGRSSKQFAISFNEITRDEMLDRVLLLSEHEFTNEDNVLREMMRNKSTKNSQSDHGRPSACPKTRVKKQHKIEVVDLTSLLIHCAQEVSENNYASASYILDTIRQHSSVSGVDTQRLASCLVDCLELRLSGTGGQVYHKLQTETSNAVEILKVYQLVIAVSPFMRAPYYFSNNTILDVSKGKQKVHIIDFGISLGFQWPSLFEQLARREEGPPKVRITGIELPQPGFRPNEMHKNAGQLLADYASMFNVPFEYKGISSKWETIGIEDLNIEQDDVLIVNCLFRMKNLGDETVFPLKSARNRVLNTIRMMKPKVFVHGIVNGSYNNPLFLRRFKEVMNHYSALFDILDKTVPQDNEARMILERGLFRCQLLNIIACEGSERIERPENYKKWMSRNLNAGFEQLPLNPDIVKVIRDMVGKYHKDYVIDEDDQWLLMGWKGRILNALSTWKPSESYDGDYEKEAC